MKNLKFLIVFCFLFSSCTQVKSYVKVIDGFYKANKGDYQEALLDYLEVRKANYLLPWVDYNIANIYQELGENTSALAVYDSLKLEFDTELLYSINFNKGVAFYALGDYKNAKESFLRALTFKSNDYDSKKNLELSLKKMKSFASESDYNYNENKDENKNKENKNEDITKKYQILEYIKYKEEQTWFTNQQKEKVKTTKKDW